MLKIKKIAALTALLTAAAMPAASQAADSALSPLPYLGAVIAHQGNEALRIIREQVRDDIKQWLPVLDGVVVDETARLAAPAQPKG
ncbi:MAG: hypothetical protein HYV18_09765 [Gammaproteobacteria bacterium]|nr:hypothetical protein [Gammaproteobacteria bacterium]